MTLNTNVHKRIIYFSDPTQHVCPKVIRVLIIEWYNIFKVSMSIFKLCTLNILINEENYVIKEYC